MLGIPSALHRPSHLQSGIPALSHAYTEILQPALGRQRLLPERLPGREWGTVRAQQPRCRWPWVPQLNPAEPTAVRADLHTHTQRETWPQGYILGWKNQTDLINCCSVSQHAFFFFFFFSGCVPVAEISNQHIKGDVNNLVVLSTTWNPTHTSASKVPITFLLSIHTLVFQR